MVLLYIIFFDTHRYLTLLGYFKIPPNTTKYFWGNTDPTFGGNLTHTQMEEVTMEMEEVTIEMDEVTIEMDEYAPPTRQTLPIRRVVCDPRAAWLLSAGRDDGSSMYENRREGGGEARETARGGADDAMEGRRAVEDGGPGGATEGGEGGQRRRGKIGDG